MVVNRIGMVARLPERTCTPVYPSPGISAEPVDRVVGEAERLGRSLRKVMGGSSYHQARELVAEVGGAAQLATALSHLISVGFAFERSGDHLRLRRRDTDEPEQLVVSLLEGADLRPVPVVPEVEQDDAADESQDFDPGADAGPAPVKSDLEGDTTSADSVERGLVLSDPFTALVVPYSEAAGMTNTILARRGSGKTYLAGVLAEELMEYAGGPTVVVVDPMGVWWGLLATADGRSVEGDRLLLGGPRGHLPLRPGDGARTAAVVAAVRPCPLVLDLSQMAPAEMCEFVADYGEAMWAGERFPVHLFVDEADEFCPQRFGSMSQEQRRSRDAVERWVMRGRSRGYGTTLVTLRPAVLSKNALTQSGCLWIMCMTAPQDVAAVAGWMEPVTQDLSEDRLGTCLGQLPVLPRGTAFMVRGGDDPALRKFKVRKKRTFDSSKTDSATVRHDVELARPSAEILAKARKLLTG
jgi:hypothetical protein